MTTDRRIVTIASQKGGVGKTTLALNLAYALGRRGWRVLLADADPQGGIGFSLSKKTAMAPGLAEHVSEGLPVESLLIQTRLDTLTLLPAGRVGVGDTPALSAVLADGEVFRQAFARVAGRFDLVLIDTASGFSGATIGALRASTHVISPVQAEPLAARSLSQLLDLLAFLRREGSPVTMTGVVLTMLQMRVNKSFGVADEIWRELGDHTFQAVIPRDPTFLEASAAGIPLGLLGRRPPAVSAAFDQLAGEVETRLQLTAHEEPYVSLVD
jgi:chromosome partitioning protein